MARTLKHILTEYGSLVVLAVLCAWYSFDTLGEQYPNTPEAGREVAATILKLKPVGQSPTVIIAARDVEQDRAFTNAMEVALKSGGATVLAVIHDGPDGTNEALRLIGESFLSVDAIATNHFTSERGLLRTSRIDELRNAYPSMKSMALIRPRTYYWPSFLTRSNILNVLKQSADIAIIAIGMTLVIITAGIDLSVGSMMAVASVLTAVCIQSLAGGSQAGTAGMIGCCMISVCVCALCGLFNGVMVTWCRVPAFITTLALLMIARGMALIIAVRYQSALLGGATEGTPEAVKIEAASFSWLGNGDLSGVPTPIVVMVLLYAAAHFLMSHTSVGRYIYAVGGNPEAARLSGVPVFGVLLFVYALCGAMAGLAGILDASRFESGRPSAGELYELRAIAAVVVGGTSLAGGQGRILGTLTGVMIIAVIQNGLNMGDVSAYEQKVVFGALILGAVLLDGFKRRT